MLLLKFSASWCQPCKALSATLSTMTIPYEVREVDVDNDHDLPAKYLVRGVPTIIAVTGDGAEVDRLVGSASNQALSNWITTLTTKEQA